MGKMRRPPWVRRRDRRYSRRQSDQRRRDTLSAQWEIEGRQTLEQFEQIDDTTNDQASA